MFLTILILACVCVWLSGFYAYYYILSIVRYFILRKIYENKLKIQKIEKEMELQKDIMKQCDDKLKDLMEQLGKYSDTAHKETTL